MDTYHTSIPHDGKPVSLPEGKFSPGEKVRILDYNHHKETVVKVSEDTTQGEIVTRVRYADDNAEVKKLSRKLVFGMSASYLAIISAVVVLL